MTRGAPCETVDGDRHWGQRGYGVATGDWVDEVERWRREAARLRVNSLEEEDEANWGVPTGKRAGNDEHPK